MLIFLEGVVYSLELEPCTMRGVKERKKKTQVSTQEQTREPCDAS